jgi:hypothetical protein
MVTLLRNPNNKNTSPGGVQLFLRPRALRPPAAAAYIGGSLGLIEQLWRDGLLPYRLVGGVRVALIEDLDAYLDSLEKKTGKLSDRHPVAATAARKTA